MLAVLLGGSLDVLLTFRHGFGVALGTPVNNGSYYLNSHGTHYLVAPGLFRVVWGDELAIATGIALIFVEVASQAVELMYCYTNGLPIPDSVMLARARDDGTVMLPEHKEATRRAQSIGGMTLFFFAGSVILGIAGFGGGLQQIWGSPSVVGCVLSPLLSAASILFLIAAAIGLYSLVKKNGKPKA